MRRHFDDFVLDDNQRQLLRDGEVVHLSPKAFELLSLLLARAPAAVSKEEIVRVVWPGIHVSDASLTNVVAEIRTATGDRARQPRFVRTVHAFGYAFCGELADNESPQAMTAWRILVAGRPRVLAAGPNLLGRDPEVMVAINHASVSRRHARIIVRESGAFIEDLQSHNGTFVNGRRIDGLTELLDGDLIALGPVSFVVERVAAAGSTQTQRER